MDKCRQCGADWLYELSFAKPLAGPRYIRRFECGSRYDGETAESELVLYHQSQQCQDGEVCHCGDYMKDHKPTGSCTNPKVMTHA